MVDAPLNYGSPEVPSRSPRRSPAHWAVLLIVWAVGLAVWAVYLVSILYLWIKFL